MTRFVDGYLLIEKKNKGLFSEINNKKYKN